MWADADVWAGTQRRGEEWEKVRKKPRVRVRVRVMFSFRVMAL